MDVLVVTRDNVRRLLLAMLQSGTVYVLGAGTSAGLVPFTSGTLAFVRRRYAEVGVYAVDSSPSPLLDRVVIGPMVDARKRSESVVRRGPPRRNDPFLHTRTARTEGVDALSARNSPAAVFSLP